MIAKKLKVAQEARERGKSALDAAALVRWSRPTYYRRQAEHDARELTR